MKFSLEEATAGPPGREVVRQERKMEVVDDVTSASLVANTKRRKRKLVERFEKFSRCEWNDMFWESAVCDEKAAVSRRRSRQRENDDLELSAARAEMLVQLGELSSARLALEGTELAPGDQNTSHQWTDVNEDHRERFPTNAQVTSFK